MLLHLIAAPLYKKLRAEISSLTYYNKIYPARKAYETTIIREGILFQIDAIAFKG
jgi:hypothetical protein